jgi:enoyl-CoA hydratase
MSDPVYGKYTDLKIERKDGGILLITMNRPRQLNAMTYKMHSELARIWVDVDEDPKVKVAVITGAERAFSAGNDLNNPDPDAEKVREIMREAVQIARNMVECSKPIISAINGVAVGGGTQVALMADISIAAEDAKIIDGHTTVGVTAGDHGALIWPLLCGMAKAKYYLFNCEPLLGKEAERIGVVTKAVPKDQVLPVAMQIAGQLSQMSQIGIRGTKRAINGWLRMAMPILEHSAALEMADFFHPDLLEARASFREKRPARFPSAAE